MTEVVSIKFKNRGKPYFFDPAGLELELGEHVLVDTAGGMEMGAARIMRWKTPPSCSLCGGCCGRQHRWICAPKTSSASVRRAP